jgi:hypothetical protein
MLERFIASQRQHVAQKVKPFVLQGVLDRFGQDNMFC